MNYSDAGQKASTMPAVAPPMCGSKGKLDQNQATPRNLTEYGAALNMLKFVIGLGIVSLPEATKHVGWLPSIIGLAVIGFVTVWGIFFALQSRDKLEKMEEDEAARDIARAVTEGDPLVNVSWQDLPDSGCGFFAKIVGKVYGPSAQNLFAASIALGQFTTLVIYIIVISVNLESYFPDKHLEVLLGVVFVLGVFSLTPTLQGVAVLSAFGLSIYVFLFIGVIAELHRKVGEGSLPASAVMVKHGDHSYGQWFGISCFAFSGFPIATVIYDEMSNPQSFYKVLNGVFFVCWIAYSSFALLGFLCYGEDAHTLIYFNFEAGSVYRNTSGPALACILLFSFVVQAMPLYTCAAQTCSHFGIVTKPGTQSYSNLAAVRWTILAATVIVAYLIPSVKVMMNTMGAISGVLSGFVFPALVYLKLSSRDDWWAHCRCCIVLAVGIVGAIYSCAGL